jgi:colanic acid/amylovoran biosynthesis glycosyltransferase
MKKNRLVVIVNDYPLGYGEPFFENELTTLSESFTDILLLITNEPENKTALFHLPDNVKVIFLNKLNNNRSLLYMLSLNYWAIIKELFHIIIFLKLRITISILKDIFFYERERVFIEKGLIKIIKEHKVDILSTVFYTYWFDQHTYSLSCMKKRNNKLCVYSRIHGWDLYFERHESNYLPFRAKTIRTINKTITISNQGYQYLKTKLKIDATHIETGYLGTEKQRANQHLYDKKTLYLLSLSFISPVKNLTLLIDAISISSVNIEWTHIGGSKEQEDEIKSYAREKISDKSNIKYRFMGTLDSFSVHQIMSNSPIDLFINTSHSEGLPVSMMEAISHEIPIVGPNVGGIGEIILHTQNGYLLSTKPMAAEICAVIQTHASKSTEEIISMKKKCVEVWGDKFNARKNYIKFTNMLNHTDDDNY